MFNSYSFPHQETTEPPLYMIAEKRIAKILKLYLNLLIMDNIKNREIE